MEETNEVQRTNQILNLNRNLTLFDFLYDEDIFKFRNSELLKILINSFSIKYRKLQINFIFDTPY